MKTRLIASVVLPVLLAGFSNAFAVQADPAATAPAAQKQVRVSEAASVLLKLAKGQVSEQVIVTYIENARRNFELSADEIVYLKQEGVSDKIVAAALAHHASIPQAVVSVPQEPAPAPMQSAPQQTVVMAPPQTTYVEAAPQPVYVYSSPSYSYFDAYPYYYSYYPYRYPYYPYRNGYGSPTFSVNFGFGHGYYGGGYRGGFGGGYRGGFSGSHVPSYHSGSAHNIGFGGHRR